jgi:hypothetical protein
MKHLPLLFFLLVPPLFVPQSLFSSTEIVSADASTEIRTKMMAWSRQLGVTCVHCHNLENFKDKAKLTFKTALKHSQMVRVLQDEVFTERDKGNALKIKVDCYMCHRGKDLPAYQEPANQLTR